jgi:xanthine dehydrogenase YagR molybdenum-binding subunit
VRVGDTQFPPSGGSGGSTTAASVSPAIYDVCHKVLDELQQQSGVADARGDNWKDACRKLGVNPLQIQGEWISGLSSSGVGGVQFAEVDVDTDTGFVKVRKITCVQDCGLVMSKLTAESQVNGGIIMGIGYALYEGRMMDRQTGVLLNPNFETYKLAGLSDVPELDVVLLDMPERGVIGIGEPVTIPTAAAIGNAVANAIGVRVSSLPITPQRVLAALGKDKLST